MLFVIGFHSLIGGGQTPLLAAGFKTISKQFDVSLSMVAYTTGAYMFALGIGSVFAGPAASLYGKRVVYLTGQVVFFVTCIWAAVSPSYVSLLAARIVEGFGVSPVECLPSSSISEIFFLHERAFRLGIYSMLLLGGKNIVPLVSAAIIEGLGWRWVFGIVAIIVAGNFVLTFIFVPETSWDRNVKPAPSLRSVSRRTSIAPAQTRPPSTTAQCDSYPMSLDSGNTVVDNKEASEDIDSALASHTPEVRSILRTHLKSHATSLSMSSNVRRHPVFEVPAIDIAEKDEVNPVYVKKTWRQQLALVNGRLTPVAWWKIVLRPFILFAYPAILFSTIIYSLSVVWLIVLSESLGQIFQAEPYNFNALQVGLIYIAPLIGGILGSAIAGKMSDILTRYMARKNNGIYEPEFRLVLALPVMVVTAFGLIGFGWSADTHDPWIAPTVFFGCISFGCSLGSTMAISFVVDSYKQHAGEALVTLNLTKNTLGFIFSLWFNEALTHRGSKVIFVILGSLQCLICLFALPLYIYGKRLRGWTYRSGMIDWLYE